MKKYFVMTFGCQMNQADSEKVNMILMQAGLKPAFRIEDADVVVLNTCSVRQKGEDRVFGVFRDLKKNNPNVLVGITGCMIRKTWMNKSYLEEDAERTKTQGIELLESERGIFNFDDHLFVRMPKLDFTFRIEEVTYLTKILSHISGEQIGADDKFDDYLKSKQMRENPSSANIIIQTGCDNYCTYCIVPFTRGKEVSRDKSEIISEVKEAVKNWAKEITLLGQNVNSYGKQTNLKLWNQEKSKWNEGAWTSPFRELLNELNEIEGLDRIRFTSSNPHDMTEDILSSHIELDATCNYLHFALQSGSDDMLKRMNRRHSYKDFKAMVEYLRSKDPLFAVSTDIIVWFSGETEEMFQETVKAVKEIEFDFVYIARYSVRRGTLAEKMLPDDISNEEKARRWHILNEVLQETVKKRNEMMVWREEDILVSKVEDWLIRGRTRNFKEVFVHTDKDIKVWELVKTKILKLDNWILVWKLV